jgi:PilZ domain.
LSFSEQRKAARFNGEILLDLKKGKGLTSNFSADGIYFTTDQTLCVDEEIDFVMLLEHSGAGKVHCCGRVLRVEKDLGTLGVAVAITAQRFEAGCRAG